MYISQIFANEIEIAKSQLEEGFGLKGRVYDQSYNKILLWVQSLELFRSIDLT